jgi:hypothetical protein
MHIPKKYYHDRIVLLLLSASLFLVLLEVVSVFIGQGSGGKLHLIQYRPYLGRLSAYTYSTSVLTYMSFIIFAGMVMVIHSIMSIKLYSIRRQYSLAILSMGVLLLVLSIIVSNALMYGVK